MKEVIQAVHPADVRSFFEGLDIHRQLDAGEIVCHACGDVITLENFKAVTRHGGNLMFACDKLECLEALAALEGSTHD